MYDFIVLGLIPGTQIQITFQTWLFAASILLFAFIGRKLLRSIWGTPTYRLQQRLPIRRQVSA